MKLSLALIILMMSLISCTKAKTQSSYKYLPATKKGVVAKVGNVEISYDELMKGIEMEVFEAEQKVFDVKDAKLKMMIIEKFMEMDPNKKGLSADEYLDKYIASSITVSDKQVEDFIKEKKIPAQHINDQIKGRIREFLKQDLKKNAVDEWLVKKTAEKPVEVYLEKPRRPSFDVKVGDSPFAGSKDAKVTIVEFSDFQCPFCAKGAELVSEIKKKYGDKVKVAFKHFPLPFHKQAMKASEASLCVYEQDTKKFWPYHDKLFGDQKKLGVEDLKATAAELGIDKNKFDECLSSNKFRAVIEKDLEQGKELGVRSTPTFFVNGQLVNGAQPIEVFAELIDEGLKAQ